MLKNRILKSKEVSLSEIRLKADYIEILKSPILGVKIVMEPEDILEWHFVIKAPDDSKLIGYYFYGRILFPCNYPFSPPMVVLASPPFDSCILPYSFNNNPMKVLTTSKGSITNPPWNPSLTAWHVINNIKSITLSSIISDLLLGPVGAINLTSDHRKLKNRRNLENSLFCKTFPGVVKEIIEPYQFEDNSDCESVLSDFTESDFAYPSINSCC